jgi:hypothetical protein
MKANPFEQVETRRRFSGDVNGDYFTVMPQICTVLIVTETGPDARADSWVLDLRSQKSPSPPWALGIR